MAQNISFYGDLEKEVSHYCYLGEGLKPVKAGERRQFFIQGTMEQQRLLGKIHFSWTKERMQKIEKTCPSTLCYLFKVER